MNVRGNAVGVLLNVWVRKRFDNRACVMIHQLVAATESSDDGEVRRRSDKEKTELEKNLAKSTLRCQVNAHGHVVEDDDGNERRRNL